MRPLFEAASVVLTIMHIVYAFIKEEHTLFSHNSEEIHSWVFDNERHLVSSKLWRELEDTPEEFNTTTIYLNESKQILILSSTNPLTFYEFEAGDPNTFSDIVALTGCLRMVNNTSSITHIDAQGFSLSTPPGISFGVSLLLVSLASDYGLDGLGTKLYMSNTVICRSGSGETIQIQTRLKFISFPKARLKKIIWNKKRRTKSFVKKLKGIFHRNDSDGEVSVASFGTWTEGKWADIYTLYKYKKLGLLFFNLSELKHAKPFCESRPEYLQCSLLTLVCGFYVGGSIGYQDFSNAEERHITRDIDGEEIHSWYFYDEEHLRHSQLWEDMTHGSGDFNETVIHFNKTNQTLVLTSTDPPTFYQVDLELIGIFAEDDATELDRLLPLNETATMLKMDAREHILKFPSPMSENAILTSLLMSYGIDDFSVADFPNGTISIDVDDQFEDEFEMQAKKLLKLLLLPLKLLKKLLLLIKFLICLPFLIIKKIILLPFLLIKKVIMLLKKKVLISIKMKVKAVVVKVKDTASDVAEKTVDVTVVVIVSIKKVVIETAAKADYDVKKVAAKVIMTKDKIVDKAMMEKIKINDKVDEKVGHALMKAERTKEKYFGG
ncbi:hypothetical protein KGF57_000758 [Candida theae]|uniref:Uncharacterized protein n=1 Tax=Candida theae TaxID=1198502 RepID=A0AAD5G0K5_9ASCO|nr:uncharacterized protein KGF57_000758 [Candida theae]KAI5965492.1 hypothetical protein KGF57_000758 [Candida theae]